MTLLNEKEIQKQISKLEKQLVTVYRNTKIKCDHCKKFSKVKDIVFIENYFYIRPYSCTGGDYWTFNDKESDLLCPKCLKRSTLYNLSSTNLNNMKKLKPYFNKIIRNY